MDPVVSRERLRFRGWTLPFWVPDSGADSTISGMDFAVSGTGFRDRLYDFATAAAVSGTGPVVPEPRLRRWILEISDLTCCDGPNSVN